MIPSPSGRRPEQVGDLELRLAEERVGALLLEDDDRAQEDADRRRRHPAVVGQDRLALVRREELQGRREVLQVEQRQVVVVAVLEDQRQDRGLGLVEAEDLAEQERPEASGPSPGPGRRACPTATGTRPGGRPARTSRPSDVARSTTFGFVASPGIAMPGHVALDVGDEDRDARPSTAAPARSWRVFVLPVPVAPAIRPWRFIIDSATWTRASLSSSPSSIGLPIDQGRLGQAVALRSSRRGRPGPWVAPAGRWADWRRAVEAYHRPHGTPPSDRRSRR